MGTLTKTNIHLVKKSIGNDRFLNRATTNVIFAHKIRSGEYGIDLTNLNLPSTEMPSFVQATANQLSSLKLTQYKNNLTIVSLTKGRLIQNADYVVTNDFYISFTSKFIPYLEVGEVFECTVLAAPAGFVAPLSSASEVRTYTLAIGQTTLPLDFKYDVNINPLNNIGQIKVYMEGVLVLRNTGNSSTTLDKTYYEPDGGDGKSSIIIFNSAPVSAKTITVDFGVRSVIPMDDSSRLEYMIGTIQTLASDLAILTGKTYTDYFLPNPTELQRRQFGNQMLSLGDRATSLESRATILEAIQPTVTIAALDINWGLANLFTKTISANSTFTFSSNADGKTIVVRLINSSASALTLAWPASVVNPVTSLSASKTGIFTFVQFGSNVYMTSLEV